MSCESPTSAGPPLSPSEESLFVPRSSLVAGSSLLERHFEAAFAAPAAAADMDDDGEFRDREASGVGEEGAAGNFNAKDESNGDQALVAGVEESGILGATICCTPVATPESSPRSSPTTTGHTALQIARNIDKYASWSWEYQTLEGISSEESVVVEDLSLSSAEQNEEVGANEKKVNEAKSEATRDRGGNEGKTAVASASPCSTLSSLGDVPFKMFETEQPDEKTTGEGGVNAEPLRPVEGPKAKDRELANTSPVDNCPLTRQIPDAPKVDDLDSNEETARASSQREQTEDITVDAILKCNGFTSSLMKIQGAISGVATSVVPSLVAFLRLPSFLGTLACVFWFLLQKVTDWMNAKGTPAADNATKTEAKLPSKNLSSRSCPNLSTLCFGEKSELAEQSRGQAKKDEPTVLLLDENGTMLLEKISGKAATSITIKDVKALFAQKTVKVFSIICALVVAIYAWKRMIDMLKGAEQEIVEDDLQCYSTHSVNFVSVTPWEWEFDLSPTLLEGIQENPLDLQILNEHDFCCLSTNSTHLASIPLWEFKMSSLTPFESFEEEFLEGQVSVNGLLSIWLYTTPIFTVLPKWIMSDNIVKVFTVISLVCAFIFKGNIKFPSTKSKSQVLVGIWTEEEHQQFLKGYNKYGNRWKLVSEFVPTRTHIQVKTHGVNWRKIGSPLKMTKSRKLIPSPSVTPKSSEKKKASKSASSTKTPRKSKRTMIALNRS